MHHIGESWEILPRSRCIGERAKIGVHALEWFVVFSGEVFYPKFEENLKNPLPKLIAQFAIDFTPNRL